jgi:hypothetical protein
MQKYYNSPSPRVVSSPFSNQLTEQSQVKKHEGQPEKDASHNPQWKRHISGVGTFFHAVVDSTRWVLII